MKTLLVYAKNYGKFPKNFIHNILWGCFYESCVAFHRNYTDRKQYIFREKTAHQAEAAPSAVIQAVSKQSALNISRDPLKHLSTWTKNLRLKRNNFVCFCKIILLFSFTFSRRIYENR